LGLPVVPDVYISIAGVSEAMGWREGAGTPAPGVKSMPSGDVGRTIARLPIRSTIAIRRPTNSGAA